MDAVVDRLDVSVHETSMLSEHLVNQSLNASRSRSIDSFVQRRTPATVVRTAKVSRIKNEKIKKAKTVNSK